MNTNDIPSQFRNALAAAGIQMSSGGPVPIDDAIHRFRVADDKEENGWFVLHLIPARNGGDPIVVGAAGCWKRNVEFKFCSVEKSQLSREDWAEASKAQRLLAEKRAAEEKAAQDKARQRVNAFFANSPDPPAFPPAVEGASMYLIAKGVPTPHGPCRISTDPLTSGWLALPLVDADGIIHSTQFIADDGTKRFQYQARVLGCFYQLSDVPGGPILICEGYATGASLYEATGWSVVCAMNCGNLLPVAKSLRSKYPDRTFVICADNDQFTESNPGFTKAKEAVKAVRSDSAACFLACPEFADEALAFKPTDFNDLHQNEGLNEVRRQVFAAFPVVARPIGILTAPPPDDPTELLKYRYLCECGALLLNGSTGLGKSSLGVQAAACWANGLDFFGIKPSKPLRIVIVQAENDDGDVAQVRDGICQGLRLNLDQRRIFFENVLVFCSRGLTGKKFCLEVLRPLLDLHQPHILQLDPMLAFLGGNAKEQEVVGQFLREYLNPLLFESKAACMGLHHTNKPFVGREKSNWVNGELAYTGSGSAEWANWARAILAVQSVGVTGFYTLHAPKRGGRLGWSTNPDTDQEAPLYQKSIAWSKEKGSIYWRSPEPDEVEAALEEAGNNSSSSGPGGRSNAGRPSRLSTDSLLSLISGISMTTTEWFSRAYSELGIPRATFYRMLNKIRDQKLAIQSVQNDRWTPVQKLQPKQPENND